MDKTLLMQFAYDNKDLDNLKMRLNNFNPFKILKLKDHEIRRSNMLGWLFDPNGSHNLDDKFLKRFIFQVLINSSNENLIDIDEILEFQQKLLYDSAIHREYKNIDILIVSETNKIVILIENKIYSSEHSDQLPKYLQIAKNEFVGYKIYPILLSLGDIEASDLNYFNASYSSLIDVIENTTKLNGDRMSEKVLAFINFYIEILKEKYVMEDDLRKLCIKIYEENKESMDTIMQVVNEIDIESAANLFAEKHIEIKNIMTKNRHCTFIVEEFKESKDMDMGYGSGYPVAYTFNEYYKKLKIILEIGPFDNQQKRVDFLNHLETNGIPISERAKQIGRKYTRIYTSTKNISDWKSAEEISDIMYELFVDKKLREIEKQLIQAIRSFDWNY